MKNALTATLLAVAATALVASGTAIAGECSAKGGKSCEGSTASTAAKTYGDAKEVDIVDTAVAAGKFNTLAAALTAAGLVDTLKGPGPFTVFAPTDEAFAKLPKETLESLLKPENKAKLVSILTYHVVAGDVKAADVVKLTEATTVNGKHVKIEVKEGKVLLDGKTTVTATDIKTTNGTIHVIDTVLMP